MGNETLEGNLLLSSGKSLYDMDDLQCLSNFNGNKRKKNSIDSNNVKSSSASNTKIIQPKGEIISANESSSLTTKIKTEFEEPPSEKEVINEYNNTEDFVKESSNDSYSKNNDIESIEPKLSTTASELETSDLPCDTSVSESSVIHHTSTISNISSISIKQEEKDDEEEDAFVIDSDDDEDEEFYESKMMDYQSFSMPNNYALGGGQAIYGSNFSDSDVLSNASQFAFDPSDENWQTQFDMSQVQSGSDGILLNLPPNMNLGSPKFSKL